MPGMGDLWRPSSSVRAFVCSLSLSLAQLEVYLLPSALLHLIEMWREGEKEMLQPEKGFLPLLLLLLDVSKGGGGVKRGWKVVSDASWRRKRRNPHIEIIRADQNLDLSLLERRGGGSFGLWFH